MTVKIGMVISADHLPVTRIIELSPMLDTLGYSQISVPEIWGYDAITLLSALSKSTKKVKLATGIISMFSRTPALTAMTSASLDELSGGRFILGLGLSGPKVIENLHGHNFTKPLVRTREYVNVVRTLLKKERLNHQTSQLGNLKDFKLSIREINSNIPIHIASLGPKNIQLTAEIADGWIPVNMPVSTFTEQVKTIKGYLKKFGKDENYFAITPFVLSIIGDTPDKLELLRNHLFYYFGTMGTKKDNFYNLMLRRAGFDDEAREIQDKFYAGDIEGAKKAVTDDIVDSMCVYGSKDEAQEKLIQFIKAGATCPLLSLPAKSTAEDAMATYTTLAPSNFEETI